MTNLARLPGRGVIEVSGADRVAFLQGLVSNDVALAAPGRAVWAAMLTPQGKWLADFFILAEAESGARLLLDCERAQAPMLVQRLTRYRLRAAVALRDASAEWFVHVAWGGEPALPPGVVAAPDPRLAQAGWRVLAPVELDSTATEAAWDAHRVRLGLPDGSRDLETDKSVLLEAGFDELSGVSWSKGCYMGQELTARTKYRGLLKRRLMPVSAAGAVVSGAAVTRDGQEVGTMRSVAGDHALAMLRLDAVRTPGARLESGGVALTPLPPAWMTFLETKEAAG